MLGCHPNLGFPKLKRQVYAAAGSSARVALEQIPTRLDPNGRSEDVFLDGDFTRDAERLGNRVGFGRARSVMRGFRGYES